VTQRTTPWGAYKGITDALRSRIESGEFPPGTSLPSEAALCAQYQVARNTVRRALDQLASEGLVVAQHGRGRIVPGKATGAEEAMPRYRAIATDLRKLIESGDLQPGAPLPSEATLVEQYGVARGTARQALAEVVGAGLAVAVPGRGRFVRPI
jgi:DNA-binding GntR family transcriptional regulator